MVYVKHAKIEVSQQLCCKTPSIHGRGAVDIQDGWGADSPDGWEAAGTPDGRGATYTTVGGEQQIHRTGGKQRSRHIGICHLISTMSDSMMSVRVICGERRYPSYQVVLINK